MSEDGMTEQPQSPAPGAAPVPAFPSRPVPSPQEAPVPADDASHDQRTARAAELERELTQIRAEAVQGDKAQLRVLPPHEEFRHGGFTVGTRPSPVPVRAVAALLTAADEAGVKIEEVS